jgi:hypothetical protein
MPAGGGGAPFAGIRMMVGVDWAQDATGARTAQRALAPVRSDLDSADVSWRCSDLSPGDCF